MTHPECHTEAHEKVMVGLPAPIDYQIDTRSPWLTEVAGHGLVVTEASFLEFAATTTENKRPDSNHFLVWQYLRDSSALKHAQVIVSTSGRRNQVVGFKPNFLVYSLNNQDIRLGVDREHPRNLAKLISFLVDVGLKEEDINLAAMRRKITGS